MTRLTIRPHRFGKEIDHFFNEFFTTQNCTQKSEVNSPRVNIAENDQHISLKFEIPGIEKDEIKVIIKDGLLTVSGLRQDEFENDRNSCIRSEINTGSFSRSFNLPESVDSEKVEANYKNGILELTLSKKEEAKPKEVEISIA